MKYDFFPKKYPSPMGLQGGTQLMDQAVGTILAGLDAQTSWCTSTDINKHEDNTANIIFWENYSTRTKQFLYYWEQNGFISTQRMVFYIDLTTCTSSFT